MPQQRRKARKRNYAGSNIKPAHGIRRAPTSPAKVVIIGAGFAGLSAYIALSKHKNLFALTLFDERAYFEYTPSLHLCIDKDHIIDTITFPIAKYYPGFIQSRVEKVEDTHVIAGGKRYAYDYLVVAAGSSTNWYGNKSFAKFTYPFKSTHDIYAINARMPDAQRILVIGGGYTGVEVASILASSTDKHITLVHAKSRLLETMTERTSSICERYLRKHGVDIKYGVQAKEAFPGSVRLSDGSLIDTDMAIFTAGVKPNDDILKDSQIDESLAVVGKANVFLAGDVGRSGILPTAHNAMIEGRHVAEQIIHHARTGQHKDISKRDWRILAVALGRYWGTIPIGKFHISTPLTGLAKWIIEKRCMIEFKYKIKMPV